MEVFELFSKLNAAFGPSGDEGEVRGLIRDLAKGAADEIETDVMGNLIVHKRGNGPKLMLSAHMDSIGFVVTHVTDEGYLRCAALGGVDVKAATYTPVRFKNGTRGVFCREEKKEYDKLKADDCLIDVGARDRAQAEQLVRVGDAAVYDTPVLRSGKMLFAPYADDRMGCAVLLGALLRASDVPNDVWCVFSSQEEVGLRGAKTAAFAIQPDYAAAIDVTDTCDVPGGERLGTAKLGGGAAVKVMDRSVICHSRMVALLERIAAERGVTVQRDIIGAGGTDAGVIHTAGAGVLTGGISIPCRYIHTPMEAVDLDDAEQCAALTAALMETRLETID